MAKPSRIIENALDESHILILGSQVLLGFQYQAVFGPGFEQLPPLSRDLNLLALAVLLAAFGLLTWPVIYHRAVAHLQDTSELNQFLNVVLGIALLPFALGLGIDLYIAFEHVAGASAALAAGAGGALVALLLWYGVEYALRAARKQREEEPRMERDDKHGSERQELASKIEHVLTEARMVLPGAQLLLGFQFTAILAESFDKLQASSQYVHLASLAVIALSTVLLMMTAAYHRIVERGRDSEGFLRLASTLVIGAMALIAAGLAGDFFVVARKITGSSQAGLASALGVLFAFYALWFGATYLLRRRHQA